MLLLLLMLLLVPCLWCFQPLHVQLSLPEHWHCPQVHLHLLPLLMLPVMAEQLYRHRKHLLLLLLLLEVVRMHDSLPLRLQLHHTHAPERSPALIAGPAAAAVAVAGLGQGQWLLHLLLLLLLLLVVVVVAVLLPAPLQQPAPSTAPSQ
jgi:hypothetical protein